MPLLYSAILAEMVGVEPTIQESKSCVFSVTLHPNVRGHYALWKEERVMSIMLIYSGTGLKVPVIPSRF